MSPDATFEPGVPRWLAQAGISRGQYLQAVKTQFRSLMRPCFPLKVRVWAHGILQSTGYQRELAVRQYKDAEGRLRQRPLRPQDAQEELQRETVKYFRPHTADNLDKLKESRQNIRRAYEDLEADGVMERRRASDQKPIRELSESDCRKLAGGEKIHYYFFLEPRPASKESVLKEYEERLAAIALQKTVRSSHPVTTFSAEQLRSIRHIAKAFGLQDAPFFRLDEMTTSEHVAAIMQAIEKAKDIFIAACKEAEPEAKFEVSGVESHERTEATQSQRRLSAGETPEHSDSRRRAPESVTGEDQPRQISAAESLERSAQGTAEPPPAAESSRNSDPYTELRAGLVARGIDTLDDGALEQIAKRLNGTPIERYWLQIGERLKRGRMPFKAMLEHATAASKNYHAAQQVMEQHGAARQDEDYRRRTEAIYKARRILVERARASDEEIRWAEKVMAS